MKKNKKPGDAAQKTSRAGRAAKLKKDERLKTLPVSKEVKKHIKFPIIGVGASAGGLEALTKLLENMPADSGMAFVLVQHLAATHESMLSELLSKATPMSVKEVKDGMTVEPDNVYVIPPNTEISILHDVLHLLPRSKNYGLHLPVDVFLQSLAEDRGDNALAIIMSGTGGDGSQGIRAIKAAGGITFAQEVQSAKYSGMPASAIATGCVDFILTPNEIASELLRISRHPYLARTKSVSPAQGTEIINDEISKLFVILRTAKGVDFTYYKPSTIRRRIMRRMVLLRIEKIEDYIKHVRDNPSEVEALYQDILINVTSFFREPETCKALKFSVFPYMTGSLATDVPIRLWIAGCSTGEEAYSHAICLLEYLTEKAISRPVQIFATDIDDAAIEKARKGIYPESISNNVSSERLNKFFVKIDGGYQIIKAVRDMCIFARHNLVKDPPFSRIDFISCRNVMIYFGPALQKKALTIMHYAINDTGFLMLGISESIGDLSSHFELVDNKNKIYFKKLSVSKLRFEQSSDKYAAAAESPLLPHVVKSPPVLNDILKQADSIVVTRYSPAGVVINDGMKVLQFRGNTSPYIEHEPGEASLNLMKMCREHLTIELRTAIQKAKKENAPVKKEGLKFKHNNKLKLVDIEIVPFTALSTKEMYFLVFFNEAAPPAPPSEKKAKGAGTPLTAAKANEIKQLQKELASTREYLSSVTAEHEASNEELMALNEELQSSNEEMQSINEELETAKEELQSTNEELTTVNDELKNRNEEMTVVNDDLVNVLTGIEIPVVLLGDQLQIRRFNSSAGKILNLIHSDVGRSITNIRTNLNLPDLQQMITEVIDTLTIKTQEIQDIDGRWYSIVIRPYKTTVELKAF